MELIPYEKNFLCGIDSWRLEGIEDFRSVVVICCVWGEGHKTFPTRKQYGSSRQGTKKSIPSLDFPHNPSDQLVACFCFLSKLSGFESSHVPAYTCLKKNISSVTTFHEPYNHFSARMNKILSGQALQTFVFSLLVPFSLCTRGSFTCTSYRRKYFSSVLFAGTKQKEF
jgi:hypothetical protein